MLFAYIGPETLLPLTSIVAAGAGFVMMFGRQVGRFLKACFHLASRRPKPADPTWRDGVRLDQAEGVARPSARAARQAAQQAGDQPSSRTSSS